MATAPPIVWPFSASQVSEYAGTDRGGGVRHYGTDFAVPHGTPVIASVDGTVVRTGDDGLGAWCIDILTPSGLLMRGGHFSRMDVHVGQHVTARQQIGLSGGTPGTPGAGMSTGAHYHWELRWDRLWSGGAWIDPRTLASGGAAGGSLKLSATAESQIAALYAAEFGPENVGSTKLSWKSKNGPQSANYGHLEVDIYTQKLVSQLIGQVTALTAAVKALPGGGSIDMAKLEAAAKAGAEKALSNLTLKASK